MKSKIEKRRIDGRRTRRGRRRVHHRVSRGEQRERSVGRASSIRVGKTRWVRSFAQSGALRMTGGGKWSGVAGMGIGECGRVRDRGEWGMEEGRLGGSGRRRRRHKAAPTGGSDYFRRLGTDVGGEAEEGERALAVSMESRSWLKRSLMVPGEWGTRTVLVRSLAATSLRVSKY